MLRFILPAMLLVASLPTFASASVLSKYVTLNGIADGLATTTPAGRAVLVKGEGNTGTGIESGDVVYGFVVSKQVLQDLTHSNPFNPENPIVNNGTVVDIQDNELIIAAFSGQIGITSDGLTLSGFSGPNNLAGLLSSYAGEFSGIESSAVVAVLSGTALATSSPYDDVDASGANDLDNFLSSFGFSMDIIGGLGQNGFFQAVPFSGTSTVQRGAFDVLKSNIPGVSGYLGVPVKGLFPGDVETTANLAFDTTFVAASDPSQNNGWSFQTSSSSLRFNAIPEPATIAIWSAIGLGFVGFGARRRFAKKA